MCDESGPHATTGTLRHCHSSSVTSATAQPAVGSHCMPSSPRIHSIGPLHRYTSYTHSMDPLWIHCMDLLHGSTSQIHFMNPLSDSPHRSTLLHGSISWTHFQIHSMDPLYTGSLHESTSSTSSIHFTISLHWIHFNDLLY